MARDENKWRFEEMEQRYHGMMGRFNRAVPRLKKTSGGLRMAVMLLRYTPVLEENQ